MPTYVVTAATGRLSKQQKNEIAACITNIHCSVTGAPAYFAQVLFNDVPEGNYFVAGKPLSADILFIHGQIRAGRSLETKQNMIFQILESTAKISAMDQSSIQVYIADFPGEQIAEWGRILPKPGQEAEWITSVPDQIRQRMESLLN